jgi:hypothetical protein
MVKTASSAAPPAIPRMVKTASPAASLAIPRMVKTASPAARPVTRRHPPWQPRGQEAAGGRPAPP